MLPIIPNDQPLTMSSREIADLTGKEHSNVKRDIAVMILRMNYPDIPVKKHPKFNPSELKGHEVTLGTFNHAGNEYEVFHLNQEYTILLVSGYDVNLRMAIIKRWQELEAQQAPKIPQTFSEALQLAADQAKQLELQAPKVAFVDKLVTRDNLMTATQVAQKHGKSARWLNVKLMEHDVYSKVVKRSKVFRQWFIDKGYGEVKQSETGFDQSLFTNAGEAWINELLTAYRYV